MVIRTHLKVFKKFFEYTIHTVKGSHHKFITQWMCAIEHSCETCTPTRKQNITSTPEAFLGSLSITAPFPSEGDVFQHGWICSSMFYINGIAGDMLFWVGLLLLDIMSARFTHGCLRRCGFFILSAARTLSHSLIIRSTADGHLGDFQLRVS